MSSIALGMGTIVRVRSTTIAVAIGP
jgi:hypothetical protein